MESQKLKEKDKKKVWIKPQLIVYGDIEKITNTCPGPTTNSAFRCSG